MKETIETIMKWHKETFPDATYDGQRAKFWEELQEFDTAKSYRDMVEELADMFIVACGIIRFDTVEAMVQIACVRERGNAKMILWADFETIVDVKMKKNRKRVWNKTGNGTYHHELGVED